MLEPHIENVTILVDDWERPSGVVEELEKLSGVLVRIEHLAVGDYKGCPELVQIVQRDCWNVSRQCVRASAPPQSS
jgi:ERCC4-type nuclease